jgi:tRNA threonylcarbamoyladenosine biosynthesis protein TsaB
MALKRPLVGVSTLEALAAQAYCPGRHVCPMIDARKQQVYTCLYRCSETGALQMVVPETVTAPERWLDELPAATVFIGDAACMHRDYIEKIKQNGLVAPDFLAIPRAATVALLARKRCLHSAPEDSPTIAPCYVRQPDAELNSQRSKGSFNPAVPRIDP